VTMLLKRGTWMEERIHRCCFSKCRNGNRRR
jgi:hypothetical protein